MTNLFYLLQTLLKSTNQLITNLSRPNPKYTSNGVKYEITHLRHKILLTTNIILNILLFTDTLINRVPLVTSITRSSLCLALCFVLILSSRFHPCILNVSYTLCFLACGPYIMTLNDGGVYRACLYALLFPIFTYMFIGDLKYFLFQIAIQILYVNKLYYPRMEKTFAFMSPELITRTLIFSINLSVVFCAFFVFFTHFFVQVAFKRISTIEKTKDEAENQKFFLMGFSHELRNLLNSLIGNVKLASLELVTLKAKELILNAEVCGELLLHLVNNILDTGKVEIGELEINPVPTRIYETLEKIWGICSELIKRKNLDGKIRISKDLPKNLMIDHYRLTQIFLNLVGNSVKFTEKGSIDIDVEWLSENTAVNEACFQPYPFDNDEYDEGLFEKKRALSILDQASITLNLVSRKISPNLLKQLIGNTSRGVLKIAINDTGCGMSEDDRKQLFQKFTQVNADASKRKLGTGLGLFITKELCQRMQGDIRVFSQTDYGSVFIFCIPAEVVQERYNINQDVESMKRFVKSQKLKAMIVDDTAFNCTVLKNFFDKLGIEVIDIASNGLEAFHKYSERIEKGEPLGIITMDIEMPVMNGKEAIKKIRKLETEKGIKHCFMPIISGNCSDSEISECLNKNGMIKADVFIKKPATIEELLLVICQHFASYEKKEE